MGQISLDNFQKGPPTANTLIFGLLASRTVRLLCKLARLWYFIAVALGNQYNISDFGGKSLETCTQKTDRS